MDYEALDKKADELLEKHNAAYQAEREEVQNLVKADDKLPRDDDEDGEKKADDNQPRQTDDSAEKIRIAEDRVRNAQAKMTQAAQEAADLRRRIAELENEAKESKRGPEQNLDQLAEEYPSLIPPLLDKISRLEERLASLSGNVQKNEQQLREREEYDAGNRHLSAILKEHPDALDIIEQKSFESWKNKQAPAIQSITETGSAADVNWMLSQYKASIGNKGKQTDPDDLTMPGMPKARRTTAENGKPRFTREQIKRMSHEEFSKNEALIDEAMASGLIM